MKRIYRLAISGRMWRGVCEAGGLGLLVGAAWQVGDVYAYLAGGIALLLVGRYGLGA